MDWHEYQKETAALFASLGMPTTVDARVVGTRTCHDVDVLVHPTYAGFDLRWIVECKLWSERVSKLHVLALRAIVSDVGADRGIIVSESGFQAGAIEAARDANVELTSLALLRERCAKDLGVCLIRDLQERIFSCEKRYWDIPKARRIEMGLRPEWYEHDFHGGLIIEGLSQLLGRSASGVFPVELNLMEQSKLGLRSPVFSSPEEVVALARPLIQKLEHLLGP